MTAISNTTTAKRDRHANGAGLRAYFRRKWPRRQAAHLTAMTTTNQAGYDRQEHGVTVGLLATPVTGMVPHSGNAATRYAPFLPLAVGDTDIRNLGIHALSGGTAYTGSSQRLSCTWSNRSGGFNPGVGYLMTERDCESTPIDAADQDGACLRFLLFGPARRRTLRQLWWLPTGPTGVDHGQKILDLINGFAQWRGNTFTLAALIVENRRIDRQRLVEMGFPEAAEVI